MVKQGRLRMFQGAAGDFAGYGREALQEFIEESDFPQNEMSQWDVAARHGVGLFANRELVEYHLDIISVSGSAAAGHQIW